MTLVAVAIAGVASGAPRVPVVAAGDQVSAALLPNGRLLLSETTGALPDAFFGKVRSVAAGGTVCVLDRRGPAVCQQDLGLGDQSFTQLSVGRTAACGIDHAGEVSCSPGLPEIPAGDYRWVGVGTEIACGLRKDGSAACWGSSVVDDVPRRAFTQLAVGASHVCGLDDAGEARCWGRNLDHQCDAPAGPFVELTAGWGHSCGRRADGQVLCWGMNRFGQTDVPEGVFTSVDAGGLHTCGVHVDGQVILLGRRSP